MGEAHPNTSLMVWDNDEDSYQCVEARVFCCACGVSISKYDPRRYVGFRLTYAISKKIGYKYCKWLLCVDCKIKDAYYIYGVK